MSLSLYSKDQKVCVPFVVMKPEKPPKPIPSKSVAFTMEPQNLKNLRGRSLDHVPRFRIRGLVNSVICDITRPFTGYLPPSTRPHVDIHFDSTVLLSLRHSLFLSIAPCHPYHFRIPTHPVPCPFTFLCRLFHCSLCPLPTSLAHLRAALSALSIVTLAS